MNPFLAASIVLLAFAAVSHSAVWTATEDSTGQLNVIGHSHDGELRIVIKGKDVKVFALLKSLAGENAATVDVSTTFGARKAKAKWTASVDPARAGTLLQAPNGPALLNDFLKASGSTFSIRVMPSGKLSVVADFSLAGFEDHRAQIEAALAKPPNAAKAPPKAR